MELLFIPEDRRVRLSFEVVAATHDRDVTTPQASMFERHLEECRPYNADIVNAGDINSLNG